MVYIYIYIYFFFFGGVNSRYGFFFFFFLRNHPRKRGEAIHSGKSERYTEAKFGGTTSI